MRSTGIIITALLLLTLSIATGREPRTQARSFASGSSSASGRVKGVGTATVTTQVSSSRSSSSKGSGSRGRRGTRQSVEVGDKSVTSISSTRGTGSVTSKATATSTSRGSKGTVSSTVGGSKKTFGKTSRIGSKTTRTTTKPLTGPSRTKTQAFDYNSVPTCTGLASFRCCERNSFTFIDGGAYCGCWGSPPTKDHCSFERVNERPTVVQDIFAAFQGQLCRCPDRFENIVDPCEGRVHNSCCSEYDGDSSCMCTGTRCDYIRVSKQPLIWRHARIANVNCACTD